MGGAAAAAVVQTTTLGEESLGQAGSGRGLDRAQEAGVLVCDIGYVRHFLRPILVSTVVRKIFLLPNESVYKLNDYQNTEHSLVIVLIVIHTSAHFSLTISICYEYLLEWCLLHISKHALHT